MKFFPGEESESETERVKQNRERKSENKILSQGDNSLFVNLDKGEWYLTKDQDKGVKLNFCLLVIVHWVCDFSENRFTDKGLL